MEEEKVVVVAAMASLGLEKIHLSTSGQRRVVAVLIACVHAFYFFVVVLLSTCVTWLGISFFSRSHFAVELFNQ